MTYTTQQLKAMTNPEINRAIAAKYFGYPEDKDIAKRVNSSSIDYCNNPNDIVPLAFERGIKLSCVACPSGSGFVYYAKSYDGQLQSDYDSACRAIACLILMMED